MLDIIFYNVVVQLKKKNNNFKVKFKQSSKD